MPLAPEGTTLVDIGAGLGRVVLHAARRPYRRIVGVEISPALYEVANDNLAAYRGPIACRDMRLVRADAAAFTFPRGDLVVYLYNPFRVQILGPLLDRLCMDAKREVCLVYHTPAERAVVDAHAAFVLETDLGFGLIYRFRREVHGERRILGGA